MGPENVVLLPPPFDDHSGLAKSIENLPVEQLISQLYIKGFVVSILPGVEFVKECQQRYIRQSAIYVHGDRPIGDFFLVT